MIELSDRCILRLQGPDRVRYLNGQVTNDVTKLQPPKAMHACVTNLKGKLEAEVFIRIHSGAPGEEQDCLLIDGPPGLAEELHARLDRYIIADDCELDDVSDQFAIFHAPDNSADSLPPDIPHDSFQVDRYGTAGLDILVPSDEAAALRNDLSSRGALLGEEDLLLPRIRRRVPAWGKELTPGILPAEAGLDATAIDFHKGCYIGQEVISRIKSVGRVNRSLQLMVSDDESARTLLNTPDGESAGISIYPAGGDSQTIGTVTSIACDSSTGRVLALGFVKRGHESPGTRVLLRTGGENILSCPFEIRKTAEI